MIMWSGKENRAADILNQSHHCHFYSKTATNKTATPFFLEVSTNYIWVKSFLKREKETIHC